MLKKSYPNNRPVTVQKPYYVTTDIKCLEKQKTKSKYLLKHYKSIVIEVDRQTSYKELHELARKHFDIPTKIVIFLGNYQTDSLEQTLRNVETYALALKKKENVDCIFVLPKKFVKIAVPVINGEKKNKFV